MLLTIWSAVFYIITNSSFEKTQKLFEFYSKTILLMAGGFIFDVICFLEKKRVRK
jgi:hypothetical protein